MKYIKPADYKKIVDKIHSGDESARKFLAGYMSMSDDEANKALAEIVGDRNSDTIKFLIQDEFEAIQGYDKAIMQYRSLGKDTATLEKIKEEETKHVEMLKGIK